MVKDMGLFKKKPFTEPTGFSYNDLPPLPPLPELRSAETFERRAQPQANKIALPMAQQRFPEHEPILPEFREEKVERRESQNRREVPEKDDFADAPKFEDLSVSPLDKIELPEKLAMREEPEPKREIKLPSFNIKREQESPIEKLNSRGDEMGRDEEEHESNVDFRREMPEERLAERPVIRESPATSKARVFVKLDKYNEIIRTINSIENKINDLQTTIRRINDIKSKEKEIIDNWDQLLTATKNTISDVNARLPSPEEY